MSLITKIQNVISPKMKRSEIINALIKKHNYKTYLEIGVSNLKNFNTVEITLKHGVDPNAETTFTMTSNEFFEKHIKMKYDIIFIDGLHIFEQAYKDIIDSLKWLSDDGAIVVHDCNPIREIDQRREGISNMWNGDVWKAILKLRMEKPDLAICTVDTDYGCGIIQRGHQKLFSAPPNTDVYTFDFLQAHRKEILNLISVRQFKKTYLA